MIYNLINYKPALERLDGDISLYKMLIPYWFETKQFDKEKLLKLNKLEKNEECVLYIHSLKGAAANLGAEQLRDVVQNLEDIFRGLKQGDKDKAIDKVEKVYIATCKQLKVLQNNL